MQREVDLVRAWSREWRLTLAAEKCQTTLFTTDTHKRSWKPSIQLNGVMLEKVDNPVLLGVKYGPALVFHKHAEEM